MFLMGCLCGERCDAMTRFFFFFYLQDPNRGTKEFIAIFYVQHQVPTGHRPTVLKVSHRIFIGR